MSDEQSGKWQQIETTKKEVLDVIDFWKDLDGWGIRVNRVTVDRRYDLNEDWDNISPSDWYTVRLYFDCDDDFPVYDVLGTTNMEKTLSEVHGRLVG